MDEKKLIKKQLIKGIILNFIAFTLIFTVFAFTIFTTLKIFIYQSSNEELIKEQQKYLVQKNHAINKINIGKNPIMQNEIKDMQNPRIIKVEWNENGKILNQNLIGDFYENYLSEIGLNKNNLNTIYELNINNEYTYRTLIFESTNTDGEKIYIQLLINVNSESEILESFLKLLSIGTIITIILSIIASYVLSKKSMEPIVNSMEKHTEFVQNASHELRTPLTIIQAKQELLLQEPEAKILDKAEEIRLTLNETKRLTKLTKDLMVLARSDSNTMNIQREKIDIDNMIKEITKPYIEIAEMQEKQIELNLDFKENIWLDRNKIHQLLVILLDNAIKYTESLDKIEIKTEAREGKCIIEIKDTGIGISKEGLEHIFERFYREDKARTRENGGSGLGLAIAECIVTAHKGTIKATQNNPKGTIFTIKLPR